MHQRQILVLLKIDQIRSLDQSVLPSQKAALFLNQRNQTPNPLAPHHWQFMTTQRSNKVDREKEGDLTMTNPLYQQKKSTRVTNYGKKVSVYPMITMAHHVYCNLG